MTQDDWQLIEAAFAAAVAADGDTRERIVADFSAQHPGLADELTALLLADQPDEDDLSSPIAATVDAMAGAEHDPWVGRTVGAWTIDERIAQGGMGAVFLARRSDDTYRQTVAVKVMAAQLVASDAIQRFRAERQILANLDHPYIAKLIDGGSTDDGLPYLVMDYVDGLPIDKHCEAQRLDIDARLTLFGKVCEAVDYAHRNLIVHRDLKPSNILVDKKGNPRLLDFGIAKLLGHDAYPGDPLLTQVGSRILTPEYASPEQVRGEPVTVATDVYSLGVLLYWLITGQSPYGRAATTSEDLQKAVINVQPTRPSQAVTGAQDGTREYFGISAQRLRRHLHGDLDNIALKSLQKDPARRYPTAIALANDVQRYMRREPVLARGDGWLYVASRFAARHSKALAVLALVTAGAIAQTLFYTWRLEDERDRANVAATQSSEVAGFLGELFDSAAPHTAKGQTPSAVDLLEQGVERIDALNDQPAVQLELKRIMGTSFLGLGDVDRARALLRDAVAGREEMADTDPLALANALHDLSEAHRQYGDLEDAERELRRALALREPVLPPNHDVLNYTLARLGVILFDQGRPDEGIVVEQRALQGMIANGQGETSDAIDIRGNLANALANVGRIDEAEAMHRETIALSERVDGPMHPNTIIRMANLGLVLNTRGDYTGSEALFRESRRRARDVWPPENNIHSFFESGLSTAQLKQGQFDAALASFQRSVENIRTGVGVQSPRYVRRLRGLANVYLTMQRYDDAAAVIQEAQDRVTALDAAGSRDGILTRVLAGKLALGRGDHAMALPLLTLSDVQFARLGDGDRGVADLALGVALSRTGNVDAANQILTRALERVATALGNEHKTTAPARAALVEHYLRHDQQDQALRAGKPIADIAERLTDPDWQVALALSKYSLALAASGRQDEAAKALLQSYADLRQLLGDDDPRVVELAQRLE